MVVENPMGPNQKEALEAGSVDPSYAPRKSSSTGTGRRPSKGPQRHGLGLRRSERKPV